jgi:hypothetical protein
MSPRRPGPPPVFPTARSGPALEPVIRHYATDHAHLTRHHRLVVVLRSGTELSGYILAVGSDSFSFELDDSSRRLTVRYSDVISVFHESPFGGSRPSAT